MGCLADDTLAAFIEGALPEEAARQVDEHVSGCPECRWLVARAASPTLHETASWSPRSPAVALSAGQRVGRYVILDVVGQGAMGIVYAARDPSLNRTISLKLLRDEQVPAVSASASQTRLLREAQAMAQLSDPHVVSVHDVGSGPSKGRCSWRWSSWTAPRSSGGWRSGRARERRC
jgi:anti-sigma factor RsiW